jgi:membrane dipeptidase
VLTRRAVLAGSVSSLFAASVARAAKVREYSSIARHLVAQSNVIDMLGLLTLDYKKLVGWQVNPHEFRAADADAFRRAGITTIHPAVGFTDGDIHISSLKDLTRWNQFIAAHSDTFLRIDRAADLDSAKATGKIGVILGLQNSAHFRTADDVDFFHGLGQRVSQPTYYNNALGGGSTDPSARLSAFGAQVIERMNRVGMAIDVSHCSDRTTLDVIERSSKPVLVTHSNCRALVPSSGRCKTDVVIQKLAEGGGVFGVTLVRLFVRPSGAATIEHALDHIEHAVQVAGSQHVGIGSDVDLVGRDGATPGRNDLDDLPYQNKIYELTDGMLRRGYTESEIQAILGGNFRRVLGQIWT